MLRLNIHSEEIAAELAQLSSLLKSLEQAQARAERACER